MTIAFPTEDGTSIHHHFGGAPQFAFVTLEEDGSSITRLEQAPPHKPGAIPRFIADQGATILVAKGMGERAQAIATQRGVQLYLGIEGTIESVVEQLRAGTLVSKPEACDHHHHEHDGHHHHDHHQVTLEK